ncbi:hypothetical protein RJ641_018190 [Dillenia turbinata]|uniref:HMA domain-containing protein n=1 Tax=Dillenia turbinata TaxID=194707 RepID=A0AAN8UNI4_9MAGN
MQQKVVINISLNGKKSSKSKAMKIAVALPGVESVGWQGKDKDQMAVTGDGIDTIALVSKLRKKVGFAEIVSVAEDKKDKEKEGEGKIKIDPSFWYNYPIATPMYAIPERTHDPCTIL